MFAKTPPPAADRVVALRALVQLPSATLEALKEGVSGAAAIVSEAEAEIARMSAERLRVVVEGTDAELEAHDARAAALARTAERAAALQGPLADRVAKIEHDIEQKRRLAFHKAAKAEIIAAEALVAKEWTRLFERIAEIANIVLSAENTWSATGNDNMKLDSGERYPIPPDFYSIGEIAMDNSTFLNIEFRGALWRVDARRRPQSAERTQ